MQIRSASFKMFFILNSELFSASLGTYTLSKSFLLQLQTNLDKPTNNGKQAWYDYTVFNNFE